MLHCQEFSYGTAQTTRQVVLLSRDNAARLRRRLQDGGAIERLDGMHVQHPDANTLAFESPRGAHRHLHHAPTRDYRDIIPGPQLGRLPQPEWYRGIRYGGLFDTAPEADVYRPIEVERRQRRLVSFVDVSRDDHRHVRQAAHHSQVLEGVVGATGDAARDATGRGANHHPLLGVGDIVAHLFHTASADKRRIAADVGMQPRRGQPGGDAHRVLLGNTDFDETLGVACYIWPNAQQVLRIGREHHGLGVPRCYLKQGLAKSESRLIGSLGAPIVCLSWCRSHYRVSSSASARAKISSLTVLL